MDALCTTRSWCNYDVFVTFREPTPMFRISILSILSITQMRRQQSTASEKADSIDHGRRPPGNGFCSIIHSNVNYRVTIRTGFASDWCAVVENWMICGSETNWAMLSSQKNSFILWKEMAPFHAFTLNWIWIWFRWKTRIVEMTQKKEKERNVMAVVAALQNSFDGNFV